MAIYSRFGCELTVAADYGMIAKKGSKWPLGHLIRATRKDDGAVRHYFVHSLKADGGINAIDEAIKAAPKGELKGQQLKDAIQQAS